MPVFVWGRGLFKFGFVRASSVFVSTVRQREGLLVARPAPGYSEDWEMGQAPRHK